MSDKKISLANIIKISLIINKKLTQQHQNQFISNYIVIVTKKGKEQIYYLIPDVNGDSLRVCQVSFLANLGIGRPRLNIILNTLKTHDKILPEGRGGPRIN